LTVTIRPARLAADPAGAFRARARRDRMQILRLAERLGALAEWAMVARPLAELEQIAHGLAGAGGVFGHTAVSEAALRVERLAERWRAAAPPTLSPRRKSLLVRSVRVLAASLSVATAGVSIFPPVGISSGSAPSRRHPPPDWCRK
jgi:hypothetical protein